VRLSQHIIMDSDIMDDSPFEDFENDSDGFEPAPV
jgi:hypothetical protein